MQLKRQKLYLACHFSFAIILSPTIDGRGHSMHTCNEVGIVARILSAMFVVILMMFIDNIVHISIAFITEKRKLIKPSVETAIDIIVFRYSSSASPLSSSSSPLRCRFANYYFICPHRRRTSPYTTYSHFRKLCFVHAYGSFCCHFFHYYVNSKRCSSQAKCNDATEHSSRQRDGKPSLSIAPIHITWPPLFSPGSQSLTNCHRFTRHTHVRLYLSRSFKRTHTIEIPTIFFSNTLCIDLHNAVKKMMTIFPYILHFCCTFGRTGVILNCMGTRAARILIQRVHAATQTHRLIRSCWIMQCTCAFALGKTMRILELRATNAYVDSPVWVMTKGIHIPFSIQNPKWPDSVIVNYVLVCDGMCLITIHHRRKEKKKLREKENALLILAATDSTRAHPTQKSHELQTEKSHRQNQFEWLGIIFAFVKWPKLRISRSVVGSMRWRLIHLLLLQKRKQSPLYTI